MHFRSVSQSGFSGPPVRWGPYCRSMTVLMRFNDRDATAQITEVKGVFLKQLLLCNRHGFM
jgi:hypothetical protein